MLDPLSTSGELHGSKSLSRPGSISIYSCSWRFVCGGLSKRLGHLKMPLAEPKRSARDVGDRITYSEAGETSLVARFMDLWDDGRAAEHAGSRHT